MVGLVLLPGASSCWEEASQISSHFFLLCTSWSLLWEDFSTGIMPFSRRVFSFSCHALHVGGIACLGLVEYILSRRLRGISTKWHPKLEEKYLLSIYNMA